MSSVLSGSRSTPTVGGQHVAPPTETPRPSALVWIGPEGEAAATARAALAASRIVDGAAGGDALTWARTAGEASAVLGGPLPLVVLDVTDPASAWQPSLDALRLAAPDALALAWAPTPEHPAVAQALAADVDWVVTGAAPDADGWRLACRLGGARAVARRRNNNEGDYRTFFALTPMPAAVVDETGHVVAANASFGRAFGDATVGRPVFDLLDATARAEHEADFRAVLRGAEDVHAAEFAVGDEASPRWSELLLFRTSPGGSGTRFAVFRNITDQRGADAALRDRERFFRAAFEQTAVGISVVPALGGWVEINPALQRMLGLPPRVTRERVMECTHPEDRALDAALFGEMLEGRRSSYTIEKRYTNQVTGAVVHGIFSLTLERDATGAPSTMFGTILDVTEQKQAEDRERAAQARFRAFFDHAPIGLAVIDFATGVGYANTAYQQLCGLADGSTTLAALVARTHPDARADDEALAAEVRSGRRAYGVRERRYVGPDGSIRWGRLILAGAHQADASSGASAAGTLFVMLEDITEREAAQATMREARQAAEAADRAKSAFLATISHEIRTPLNGVVGMAQLLDTAPLDAEHRGYIGTLLTCADQVLHLINDVLEYSKLEAGRVEVEARPFDPRRLVEDAVSVVAAQGAAKGLALTAAIAPGIPREVIGDAHRTRQILLNYLSNAVKFTSAGSVTATISATPVGADAYDLQLAVRDTGIGIPPGRLDRLFRPFSQGDASTTREYGGTGLGLAISRHLATLLGGRVWLESAPGVGSTFHATVRVATLAAPVADRKPVASVTPSGRSRLRVLVAEDNHVNRLVAAQFLKRLDVAAELVTNGQEAVEAASQAAAVGVPYHLILMDVRMPVLDGVEATRVLRTVLPEQAQPAIMAFTANVHPDELAAYLDAGMTGHLTKPVQAGDLARIVREAAARVAI